VSVIATESVAADEHQSSRPALPGVLLARGGAAVCGVGARTSARRPQRQWAASDAGACFSR